MIKNEPKKIKENLIARPPVVVLLGHIDHGKSSLLQAIKDFKIIEKESGGITQHIGAYQVCVQGKKITFLDTPGHEAFSQIRSRGVKIADIAILVIDVSEGVKAQTKEAILYIKKTGIPTIVALNKIDKPENDPEKVKRQLSQEDILVESMAGKIPSIEVSAKTGQGIPELLEMILLLAEMQQLTAAHQKPGQGRVVESYLDNLRGPTATLLLFDGTLEKGDIIATSSAFVKIKNLENFQKKSINKALPSEPVIIFGFNQVPKAGEEFKVFPDIETAKNHLQIKRKQADFLEISGEQRVLNLILKADVHGSIEAIEKILKELPQDKVALRILKIETGEVNESDIKLAKSATRALAKDKEGNKFSSPMVKVLAFRVKINPIARDLAEKEKIKILRFEVIYDLIEGVRNFMEKIIKPDDVRTDLGKVKILVNFLVEKQRQIVGGKIIEGKVKKGALAEVFRGEEKIGQGKINNLQRNKKDIDLIGKGEECGILFEGDIKIEEGDILAIYMEEKRKSEL